MLLSCQLLRSGLGTLYPSMILGRNWSLPHYEKNAPFRNVLGMACFASMSTPGKALQTVDFSPAPDALFKSLEVEIRSGEPAVLLSYTWFTTYAAKQLGIMIGHCWAPPKPCHDRLTLLKSVHIYKKHRVQYEVRTYFRHLTFLNVTGSTADTFLEYIQRNLPEGVAMKVTKNSIQSLHPSILKLSKDV